MNFSFAADRTLGKLVKWLRILGFDTIFEPDVSIKRFYEHLEPERILLTRIEKIRNRLTDGRLVFIEADNFHAQFKQVVRQLAITPKDIHVFSRCLQCNFPIIEVNKQTIYGLVPDYIWETHNNFSMCRQCERIFWRGSHAERTMEVIDQLFDEDRV